MKKKALVRTLVDVRAAPPRSLDRSRSAGPAYPRADLISRDPEWRKWLVEALRAVAGPAALAGAVGMAAAGCNTATADDPYESGGTIVPAWVIADDKLGPHPVEGVPGGGVVMRPLPPVLDKPPIVDPASLVPQVGPPAIPAPVDPPALDGETPYVRPQPRPPHVRGGIRPVVPRPDIAIPGGLRPATVDPDAP
jgi:hypothetical protein